MQNISRATRAYRDRVGFWLTIHDATVQLWGLGISELADGCGWNEQNAHDACVVLHSLAHRHLEDLQADVPDGCPAGTGDGIAVVVHGYVSGPS